MARNKVTRERARELVAQFRDEISIGCMIECSYLEKPPTIDFYEDSDCFYNPQTNRIHIGYLMPIKVYHVDSDEDFVSCLKYLTGHEIQHRRSTANDPWNWAVNYGSQVVVEEMARSLGITRSFRNDHAAFCAQVLPNHGIYADYGTIANMVNKIVNILEDGRIERIRACMYPIYEKQRRYFCGSFWLKDTSLPSPEEAEKHPVVRMKVLMKELFSLSLYQVYSKGYLMRYEKSPVTEEVQTLAPHIGKAILSSKTQGMADESIEICRILAPYIARTCSVPKEQAEAVQQMIQEFLRELAQNLVSGRGMESAPELSEKEEQGNSFLSSAFGRSDLVITLDDETYDRLEEESRISENGSGIKVKRQHPKTEESSKTEKTDSNGTNGASARAEQSEGSDSNAGDISESSDKSCASDTSDISDTSSASDASDTSGKADGTANNYSANAEDGRTGNASVSASNGEGSSSSRHSEGNESGGHGSGGESGSVSEEEIRQAIQEAASQTRSAVAETMSTINMARGHATIKGTDPRPVESNTKPIEESEVKGLCGKYGFRELKRAYMLKDDLPSALLMRGKALYKKNARYFSSLNKPTVRYMDQGLIDTDRLFALAMGETDVFLRKGKTQVFDGCAYVLMDNSGSMFGAKRTEVCKAAAVIEEGFKGLFPMKFVAFDVSGKVTHEIIKDWDEVQRKNCCWNFCLHGRDGGGNNDAVDIRIATKELLARREQKKLLIVMSDGAPSDRAAVQRAVREARKKGVLLYSIYFEEGRLGSETAQFEEMYDHQGCICCELKDVDTHLSRLFQAFSRK